MTAGLIPTNIVNRAGTVRASGKERYGEQKKGAAH
jgi:hypothetical protein